MTSKLFTLAVGLVLASSAHAQKKVKVAVVTTVTELAWVANQIGGAHVEAKPLLDGTENPHYVDALPEFIRLTAEADVFCQIGLELEVGWVPAVLKRSGNARVQSGGKGFCDTSSAIDVLEKATGPVDRSMGDVHPHGNPHYWHSPEELAGAAEVIEETLARVDPIHAADYKKNLATLQAQLAKASAENKAALAPIVALPGANLIIEYHKEFSYFVDHYGLKSFGSVEEKPGVPPSAGRLAEVAMAAKAAGVKAVLAMQYSPEKLLKKFTELSGIPVIVLQGSMLTAKPDQDYYALQREHVEKLKKTLGSTATHH